MMGYDMIPIGAQDDGVRERERALREREPKYSITLRLNLKFDAKIVR